MATTKTHFGLTDKALNNRTPMWAKNMFRITFALTTALGVYMAATNLISEAYKFEVLLGLKSLDGFMLVLSNMFGVETKKTEE